MNQRNYSMPGYFQNMPQVGSPLSAPKPENEAALKRVEEALRAMIRQIQSDGRSDQSLNDAGQMTAMQRIQALVDPGAWCPLNSLFDPAGNENHSTAMLKGLGRINGRWAVIVASDNKKLAGALVPGEGENLLRATDTAKCLRIPLVYLLNCSGVKLDEQEKIYPNRRSCGTPFYRNAELQQLGVPVIAGIYGTNPAGGGYLGIGPTILIAHAKASMAVGGAGILGGMNPKGHVDMEGALQLIETERKGAAAPPGSVSIHYDETGFFREVYAEEEGVIEAIKRYMSAVPAYHPDFFRVDAPREPALSGEELYSLLPANTKRTYSIYDILGRLFDNSELLEYKKGYGPEVVTGLAKADGLPVGVVANVQGLLMNYPEYRKDGVGVGGRLYRQGLIKMNEFVTLCARDRLPIIWIQDTSGIDVGDEAEKAEMLGLGQSLVYSIERSQLPQMELTLRRGTSAAHYVLGGPQGNNTNAFSLGTAATEIYVMNGETAAAAMYARRLVKDQDAGRDLQPTIDKMNRLIKEYAQKSSPAACAKNGLADEIVDLPELRFYVKAFACAAYQNPQSICAVHQMLLPRVLRDFETFQRE